MIPNAVVGGERLSYRFKMASRTVGPEFPPALLKISLAQSCARAGPQDTPPPALTCPLRPSLGSSHSDER